MNIRTTRLLCIATLLAAAAPGRAEGPGGEGALDGQWRFCLDREDKGVAERWFGRDLPGRAQLPGSLAVQRIGDDVTTNTVWIGGINDRSWFESPEYAKYREPGNVKIPFWLQPEKCYAGAAWYQRDIEIPAAWKGRRVVLGLERPHWETRVWLDDRFIGSNDSLSTQHVHDLGLATPGRHRLTLRVDNRMIVDVGENSHSVSDHTQGNWNGIVGAIALSATPDVWIDDLRVHPNVAAGSVKVRGRIGNANGAAGSGTVGLDAGGGRVSVAVAWDAKGGAFETEMALGAGARAWDEFSPVLHRVTARLEPGGHERSASFGLREVGTDGTQLTVNGRKIFIRGTLDCCIFPKTGHPPMDVAEWKRIIGVAKAHGLNAIRFHSWCPPEAAFVAADELGFYFHVECASWANMSTTIGDGKPVDKWIYAEADRIIEAYGNHPSFLLLAYGNEPGGKNHKQFLADWVNHYKAKDARRLYTGGAGWPEIPENQFHVTPKPRIQAWGGGLRSRINAKAPETVTDYRDFIAKYPQPVISHEIGQWCVYPNFDEIAKYTGHLKPRNFEIFRDRLEAGGMGALARPFLMASGKLQTLCYKEDIESALRTPGMGGFELLDLHDFPGQGTALVGVLDPFWEEKGYVTPAEYRRFCAPIVPLARLAKRVFLKGEKLGAALEVAQFGAGPLANCAVVWELTAEDGKRIAGGSFPARTLPCGELVRIGEIAADLDAAPAPSRCRLEVAVGQVHKFSASEVARNDWDVWIYPERADPAPDAGVVVARELDDAALAALDGGGRVLLMIPPDRVAGDRLGRVALGFSPVFWNTAWTKRQPPHTMGILCDPKHPALARFPTDFHTNWQWWYLTSRAGAMILDPLPAGLDPVIRVIDDWFTARRLGLAFEARVGRGRLLVTSIDLESALDANPVARQLRSSLLMYMAGDAFQPVVELQAAQIRGLFRPRAAPGAANLVCDGDFERADLRLSRGSTPGQWSIFMPQNAGATFGAVAGVGRKGSRCIRFENPGAREQNIHFDQVVPVQPGRAYDAATWVRTDGRAGAALVVYSMQWKVLASAEAHQTNEWQELSCAFDSLDNDQVRVVWFPAFGDGGWSSSSPGASLLDDVRVAVVEATPSVLMRK